MTVATSTTPHPGSRPRRSWSEEPDAAGHDAPESAEPELPEMPEDLSAVSTRELRVLCNRLYRLLDTDVPPFGIREDYAEVVEVLEERAAHAGDRTAGETVHETVRETFRDNPAASRFELFLDGTMAGYLKYHLRAGRIHLIETVVAPTHRDTGLESVLIRETLLNAHRRRLAPIPYCGQVQDFLVENPQYRTLVPAT